MPGLEVSASLFCHHFPVHVGGVLELVEVGVANGSKSERSGSLANAFLIKFLTLATLAWHDERGSNLAPVQSGDNDNDFDKFFNSLSKLIYSPETCKSRKIYFI